MPGLTSLVPAHSLGSTGSVSNNLGLRLCPDAGFNTKKRHVAARFSSVNVLQQLPVASSTSKPLESPTHETTASPQRTPSLYTKPAPMPKPMHAHTKHERPTAKRSDATNDKSLTNDQRNKLDHAMPVHAPYTHTSPPRAVRCASACAHVTTSKSCTVLPYKP